VYDKSKKVVYTPAQISDLVPATLRSIGLQDRLWLHQLTDQWVELLGPTLSRHARPGEIVRAALTIYVDHSAWLNELRLQQRHVLKKLQDAVGRERIQRIRLQLDPDLDHLRPPPKTNPWRKKDPSGGS
jgi:hypothetical protein